MESHQNLPEITLRYFPLKEDYIYAQLSTQIPERQYQALTGITPGEVQSRSSKGRSLILCFDKSGSMSGMPYTALQKGAQMIGESIFGSNDYESIGVCYYNDGVTTGRYDGKPSDLINYQNFCTGNRAGGSTNFVAVFNFIKKFTESNVVQDLSIIFFTDGQDTMNNKSTIMKSLEILNKNLEASHINTRYLTIGFTSSHDAPFLNDIAKSGTELGNFFYINTDQGDYSEQIQNCLAQSLSMAQSQEGLLLRVSSNCMEYKDKFILEKNLVIDDDEEVDEQTGEIKQKKIEGPKMLDFTAQTLIKEAVLNDIESILVLPTREEKVKFRIELVENPSPEVLVKAQVQLVNKLIFNSIQEVQKSQSGRTSQDIYEEVNLLDKQLDTFIEMAMKIKDREIKKEIMEEISECKGKTIQIIEMLRNATGRINNAQIAQLNDLAYRAVRKRGLQKKLDERAVKNEQFYKKLDQQLKETTKKFDFKELREKHKELIDIVGSCPLSCNDMIEALEMQDCMCLGLDIGRSEAAVADPTRLVIKDIIPTFMTADSFLDSSAFQIGRNDMAHGGFDKSTQGNLAMGLGRENITGVMPLYLCHEHWEIARRKAPPVYGFMCTLDIMGYTSSQYFTVPYLVLLKSIEKAETENKQVFHQIQKLVLETCKNMMTFNEQHRIQIIELITNFLAGPEFRTADIVASIPVMLSQLYVLTQLENYHQYFKEEQQLDLAKIQKLIRFAFEEHLRRCLKSDAQPLEKSNILNVLYPDYEAAVSEVMAAKDKEVQAEFKAGQAKDGGDNKLAIFQAQADYFKSLDKDNLPTTQIVEEEKKEEQKGQAKAVQVEKIDLTAKTNQLVAQKPWLQQIEKADSQIQKILNGTERHFNKKSVDLIAIANLLGVYQDKKIEKLSEIPFIEGNKEILLAIMFQNIMQPKNHQRRDAIDSKHYMEIHNQEDATAYLTKILTSNLRNEFSGRESAVRASLQGALSSEQAILFLETPNIYYAAAVMVQSGFYLGRGDRSQIFQKIIKQGNQYAVIKEKIKILLSGHYQNERLFKDNIKDYPDEFHTGKFYEYRLWLALVRQKQVLTNDEYIEIFPDAKEKATVWFQCLDYEGKPVKEKETFGKFIQQRQKQRRDNKQKNKAQRAKKMKI
eukprot:403369855